MPLSDRVSSRVTHRAGSLSVPLSLCPQRLLNAAGSVSGRNKLQRFGFINHLLRSKVRFDLGVPPTMLFVKVGRRIKLPEREDGADLDSALLISRDPTVDYLLHISVCLPALCL
ncbi:hypothetical protein CRENBAI_008730 [Crenichthys baileyi]|uniref:Uncharacterized protein n=1 Tax=Crenichthys baileyi TaxID=28760 RepID=A0AAV9RG14_9TELE